MLKRRSICFLLALVLCFLGVSCTPKDEGEGGLDIVCTVFPIYDWVKNCVGDAEGVYVSLLVDSGTDTHSYTPSTDDVISILECDILFCVGGESESWLHKILDNHGKDGPRVVRLLDLLGDKRLEEDRTEEHGDGSDTHPHGEENAYDEHIWLSLKNAEYLCGAIREELLSALGDSAENIKKSTDEYVAKIKKLDRRFETSLSNARNDTLLFADRFPFVYLVRDYSLEYYAAFSGCSSDTDVNFETVINLAEKLDELSLGAVLVLESSNRELANTVIAQTKSKDARILTVDSMQSIGAKAIESGASYLSIMENNLSVFVTALG